MITIDIDYGSEGIVTQLLISSLKDLKEYSDLLTKNTQNHAEYLMKSEIPKEKWEHCYEKGNYGSAMNVSIMKMFVSGDNALMNCDGFLNTVINNISSLVESGQSVLVNRNGGFCPLNNQKVVPNSIKDFSKPVIWMHTIIRNSEWINFENDNKLEKHTINTLGNNNFSYINGLKHMSYSDLLNILNEFTFVGGKGVYIYTTATDMQQVSDYCDCIIENKKLKKVWFQINTDVEIDDSIISKLNDANLEVTIDYV